METHGKYEFTQDEIRQSNQYNAIYQDKLAHGLGVGSAMNAAKRAVLHEVVNSPENAKTSGGAFIDARLNIEYGVPQEVAQMYEDAYADNDAFDTQSK